MCDICGNSECDGDIFSSGMIDDKGNRIKLPDVVIRKIIADLKAANFDFKSIAGKPINFKELPLSQAAKQAVMGVVHLIKSGKGEFLYEALEEMERLSKGGHSDADEDIEYLTEKFETSLKEGKELPFDEMLRLMKSRSSSVEQLHKNRLETFDALYTPQEVFNMMEDYDAGDLRPDFQVGEILQLNKRGVERYKTPRPNHPCKVVFRLNVPTNHSEGVYAPEDMVIVTAQSEVGNINKVDLLEFSVDRQYFELYTGETPVTAGK